MRIFAFSSKSSEERLYVYAMTVLLAELIALVSLGWVLFEKSQNEFIQVLLVGIDATNFGDALIVYPVLFFGVPLLLALLAMIFLVHFYLLRRLAEY